MSRQADPATRAWGRQRVLTVAALSLLALSLQAQHPINPDKGLDTAWFAQLRERGSVETWENKDLFTIGMPVGGIATGQLVLRGDGTLALWEIFNRTSSTGTGGTCYTSYRPESPVSQGFGVLVGTPGESRFWRLGRDDFATVRFTGEYPLATITYTDPECPIEVTMEAFSPFIPLNPTDSALPATLFNVTLRNRTEAVVPVRLLAWLENAVCGDSGLAVDGVRRTQLLHDAGEAIIVHSAENKPVPASPEALREPRILADFEGTDYGDWRVEGEAFGTRPAGGTLTAQQTVSGFRGDGLVNTFIDGDTPQGTLTSPDITLDRRYVRFLLGGGSHAGITCINLLLDGEVIRSDVGRNAEQLEWHVWDVEPLQGRVVQIQIVDHDSTAWGHINVDQIELADDVSTLPAVPLDQLPDFGTMALALDAATAPLLGAELFITRDGAPLLPPAQASGITYGISEPGVATMGTAVMALAPDSETTVGATLAWYFPNHPNGHEYEGRFDSALGVVRYIFAERARLTAQTRLWHQTFYEDSTLPRWLLFRLHSTAANLATGTCQWWKNGRFWAWEGVGCCAGTCTHVWNYEHSLARLFPSVERTIREMQDFDAGFDGTTGLVGFRSNRAYAADGQCGTVLKAYREHTTAPDTRYLKRVWPRAKWALTYTMTRDANDDGILEDSQHNTFDINFNGPNTFVGSLYLGALRAGEEMAREMGDTEFAERCRRIFESGRKISAETLWNGEYYIQRVDLKAFPQHQYGEGCLSDQMFGQGWAHQLGLGYLYPEEHVVSALHSVWRYNWTADVGPYNAIHPPLRCFASPGEAGLFTCTWPKSDYLPEGVLYKNEVWTGIEYQVAGHMAWEGLVDECLAICRGIQDRYHPARHNPYNEVECGDHYARALASWGVFTGLCGFEYHGPKAHIGFAPRLTPDDFRAAFTGAEGWGLFSQTRRDQAQTLRLDLRWGALRVKTLAVTLAPDTHVTGVTARIAGKDLQARFEATGARVVVTLEPEQILKAGESLELALR